MALGLTHKASIGPSNLSRGLLVAGGPRSGTKWTIFGTDSAPETARAVYGASDEEFAAAVEYELALEYDLINFQGLARCQWNALAYAF